MKAIITFAFLGLTLLNAQAKTFEGNDSWIKGTGSSKAYRNAIKKCVDEGYENCSNEIRNNWNCSASTSLGAFMSETCYVTGTKPKAAQEGLPYCEKIMASIEKELDQGSVERLQVLHQIFESSCK